jgi:archaellum component FlaC
MADSTISGLSAAAAADRTMEVPVNKGGGENAKVTLEQIVDLVSDAISHALSVAQVPASVTSAELASVTSGVGGAGSVTSDELSAVSSQISLTNSALGSVDNRLSVLSGIVSEEISARVASIQTLSNAVTSVDTRVNAVSQNVCVISNVLSNEISARAASIQTLSNAVTSVDTRVNAVSQGLCVLSNVVSNEISARAASIQTLSDAVTSVNARVISILSNEISILESVVSVQLSQLISAVSNVSAQSAAGSATGLQNVVNMLSNKISQLVVGGGITSAQVSDMIGSVNGANYSCRAFSAAGTAQTSVKGLQSVINRISNTFSNAFSAGSAISCRSIEPGGSATVSTKGLQNVLNTFSNTMSLMHGQTRLITTTVVNSIGTVLSAIDGLTVSVSAGGYYEYRAKLNVAMSVANTFKIGISFPGMINGAATGIIQGIGSVGASAWQSTIGNVQIMAFDEDGSGSIILSCVKGVLSVTPVHIDATFAVCTAGVIFPMYAASVSTSNVKINPGSHARLFKLN